MGGKCGKPRHKYAHLFAEYFERTLLPESDPMYLEPRHVKRQLEMPEGTYYKYKKEYEERQRKALMTINETDGGVMRAD